MKGITQTLNLAATTENLSVTQDGINFPLACWAGPNYPANVTQIDLSNYTKDSVYLCIKEKILANLMVKNDLNQICVVG